MFKFLCYFTFKIEHPLGFDYYMYNHLLTFQIVLTASLYSPLYDEWANVFKSENILVIKSEDYYKDRLKHLNQVATFLGLSMLCLLLNMLFS